MGGRRGSSISVMVGSGKGSIRARHEIEHKLERAPPEAVAEAAVAYIATTNPAVAALYLAYKVAKFAYPIVEKGAQTYEKTYEKTGNAEEAKEKAVEKMKEETVKQTAKQVVSTAVSTVVGTSVEHVEQSAGIAVDKATNTFVETAISETINEVIT